MQWSLGLFLIFWLSFLSTIVKADDAPKLIFALDLIRHGDRTPRIELPNIPHHWEEGLGQLTPKGMQQEYELGQKLRRKYVEKHHLLPTHYQRQTLYVRSTDYDRTLMSAQALLFGLYPLGTGPATLSHRFQPIPIHTMPDNDQDILIIDPDTSKFQQKAKKYVFNTPDWNKKDQALKKNYAAWSQKTGVNITTLFDLRSLADTIHIYQLYQIPINNLSDEEQKQIIQNGYEAYIMLFKPQEIGKEFGTKMLTMIIDYLQASINNEASLKYVLLSAHDTSMLALLSALGAPFDELPAYASCLNFSLYETKAKDLFVEVTYNDKLVKIPGCDKDKCTIAQMNGIINSH